MSNIYNFPDQIKGDTYKGASFEILVDDEALDLTGATVSITFRKFDFTGTVSKSLTSDDGITVSDPESGTFAIDPFIADMTVGQHVYDCQIEVGGVVKTYFKGSIQIKSEVTY